MGENGQHALWLMKQPMAAGAAGPIPALVCACLSVMCVGLVTGGMLMNKRFRQRVRRAVRKVAFCSLFVAVTHAPGMVTPASFAV